MKNNVVLGKFRQYFLPYRVRIGALIVLILLGTAIGSISPYLYGLMVDAINAGSLKTLNTLIVIYFVVTIGTVLLSLVEDYIGQLTSFRITNNIKYELFTKMIGMKTAVADQYSPGECISRVNGDADAVVSFYLDIITGIIQIIVNLLISVYFVVIISLRLSTVAVFYIPATFVLTVVMRKHFKKLAEKNKKLDDGYFGFMAETMPSIPQIKVFLMESVIYKKYQDFVQKRFALTKKSVYLGAANTFFTSFITLVSSLYIIYLSAVLISTNLLTIGAMVSFNTYINKLFSAVSNLWSINISKQQMMVSLERIMEITDRDNGEQREGGQEVAANISSLAAEGVTFGYDKNKPVLNGLNFSITRNGFYSFVGENGCGKSTLAKLLVRLYETDGGCLKIDGCNVQQADLKQLRSHVTYIPKEEFFMADTVFQNITLGQAGITQQQVEAVCKRAGIDEYIQSLKDGYQTVMKDGGANFSSGQKQKLNIARALLRDTKIMLFDEVTANLDGGAEKEILSVLKELSASHIILFISHKISSVALSDQIFVMDRGQIVAQGTNGQLMQNSALYSKLFRQME